MQGIYTLGITIVLGGIVSNVCVYYFDRYKTKQSEAKDSSIF